eukprot:TRINITY_DN93798_c0_g1_i1.p1 TRINITY_DN93798_c0_g1~~TRINITY_DN93798_c0_g1_i1.p1  ORF type:complete len:209 (-),score=3.77 TRINITY_DN93798_c0_g1_i1:8-634(-)
MAPRGIFRREHRCPSDHYFPAHRLGRVAPLGAALLLYACTHVNFVHVRSALPRQTRTMRALPATSSEAVTATQVVSGMWDAVSRGDVDKAMTFVDSSVVYEDTTFPEPLNFEQVRENLAEAVAQDYKFIIDETTADHGLSCGVRFHTEADDEVITGGRGCCFYRISPETGKLIYAFECTEPAIKMSGIAQGIGRLLAPFTRPPEKRGF